MLVREVPIPQRKSIGGWLAGSAIALVLLIVAVPAFTADYMKRCSKPEEALWLNKIGKHAKIYFIEKQTFPVGRSQTMPPWSCCPHACGVVPQQAWVAD